MSSDEKNPILEKLFNAREASDLSLRPSKYLKDKLPDGTPLVMRNYQVQMVYHLLMMKRFVVGDAAGLGKTLESIASICYIWEKEPDIIPIIVTNTSAMRQWGREIHKFTNGVDYVIVEGKPEKRHEIYEEFFADWSTENPKALILNYARLKRDKREFLEHLQDHQRILLILDEVTAVKSPKSQAHHVCKEISLRADRVYGLTATLIKNRLEEGYGIYKVVHPNVFGSFQKFLRDYCVVKMQKIPKSKRKIPIVVGHSKAHVERFRETIRPYYLGRAKHDVAKELPLLSKREIPVPLSKKQWGYYTQALDGLLEIHIGTELEEEKEITHLTELIYCQEIVDSPFLIGNEGSSGKEDALLELLQDDLEGEKVIIFTRFRTMVDRIESLLLDRGWVKSVQRDKGEKTYSLISGIEKGFVRVTGDENSEERDAGQRAFTEDAGTQIIFITMAGAEAINLQQAKYLIFFDLPWSAGDYLQIIGRMIRIGSPHQSVSAIHLLAEGPDGDVTIDHHVSDTLNKKMDLIESILGTQILEEGDDDAIIFDTENESRSIFEQLRLAALKRSKSKD